MFGALSSVVIVVLNCSSLIRPCSPVFLSRLIGSDQKKEQHVSLQVQQRIVLPGPRQALATSNLCDLSALTQVVVCSTAAAAHSDVSRDKSREVFEVRGFEVSGPSSGHSVGSWEEETEQEVREKLLLFGSGSAGGVYDRLSNL